MMEILENFDGDSAIVTLNGRLDGMTSTSVQEKLLSLIDDDYGKIILDMSAVPYVSSAGLRVLLMCQKRVKSMNGFVRLVGITPSIKEIFDISGFTQLFDFFETVEAAKN